MARTLWGDENQVSTSGINTLIKQMQTAEINAKKAEEREKKAEEREKKATERFLKQQEMYAQLSQDVTDLVNQIAELQNTLRQVQGLSNQQSFKSPDFQSQTPSSLPNPAQSNSNTGIRL